MLLLLSYTFLSVVARVLTDSLQVYFIFSFIISLSLVYVFRNFVDRKSFGSLGFSYAHLIPDSIIGLLLGVVLICLGTTVIFALQGIEWIGRSFDAEELLISTVILLMVSFGEELVFRGYVLRNLMKSFNKWFSLLISSVLFTLVHFSAGQTPVTALFNIFLGGMLMGIAFIITRSLWLPVCFHFSWNFVQGPLLGFAVTGLPFKSLLTMQVTGPPLLTGGDFGFEASVVCSVLLLFTFGLTCYFDTRKSRSMMHT